MSSVSPLGTKSLGESATGGIRPLSSECVLNPQPVPDGSCGEALTSCGYVEVVGWLGLTALGLVREGDGPRMPYGD